MPPLTPLEIIDPLLLSEVNFLFTISKEHLFFN